MFVFLCVILPLEQRFLISSPNTIEYLFSEHFHEWSDIDLTRFHGSVCSNNINTLLQVCRSIWLYCLAMHDCLKHWIMIDRTIWIRFLICILNNIKVLVGLHLVLYWYINMTIKAGVWGTDSFTEVGIAEQQLTIRSVYRSTCSRQAVETHWRNVWK